MSVGEVAMDIVGDAQNDMQTQLNDLGNAGDSVGAKDVLNATINISQDQNLAGAATGGVSKEQEIMAKAASLLR